MLNPFKKRQQKKAAAAAAAAQSNPSRSPPTDYAAYPSQSDLPPRAGIFISSAPALPRSTSFGQQHRTAAASPSAKAKGKAKAGPSSPSLPSSSQQQQQQQHQQQQQSLDHVLPPASDYRQSLIMPHLTRRFTLLRAPDGSLVSPDAMRAHLRAQRARARAANLAHSPSNQIHFLTEDEENEIIEQLKAQARQEGRDFDVERSATANGLDSWRSGYNAGTDGFGLWDATPTSKGTKLSTLAESFGDFTVVPEYPPSATGAIPPAWSPTNKTGGSSFTGRSAERDQAYIRTVQRERDHSKSGEPLPLLTSESEPASSRNTTTETSAGDSRHHSQDTAASVPHDIPESTVAKRLDADKDARAETSSTVEQDKDGAASQSFLNVPGLSHASRPRPSQDSNLLTTLSPEAFKRVSTALDEVFGLIASERGPTSSARARSAAGSTHGPQRSSIDSDTISFTSAVSNVRGLDARQGSDHVSSNQHETGSRHHYDDGAELAANGTQPKLDAVHIEQGRLALHSPLPGPTPGALPTDRDGVIFKTPDADTTSESLVPSDSVQTIRGVDRDGHAPQAGSSLPSQIANDQHLSVSAQSPATSTLTLPSERTSTATARDALPPFSRIVSTASTINAPQLGRKEAANQVGQSATATGSAIEQMSDSDQRSQRGSMLPPATVPSNHARVMRPDRTPEMTTSAFFTSPAQSTLSRGDSVVSGHSVRSSLTGPSGMYQGTHSRKSSADKLALARSMAPHPHLREQPSLSSVRRNYRQHTRSTTGSSEGSLLGGPASRRSSGAMSPPPLLSRSARSPNYFPPPSSGASMHDYASGFKPPSAISPAAAAALQSMTGQASYGAQPTPSSVMDASNALRSVQNVRNSTSTGPSIASPHVPSLGAFTSGSDRAAATSSPETGATSTSLHHRNASLNSAKQQSQRLSQRISTAEDSASQGVSAPSKAAAIPEMQATAAQPSTVENGLMPAPPADPEQAERWRSMYGTTAVDAASVGASAEDVSADPNDDEDLWAKMASASDPNKPQRPVSNFPASVAEERLAGSGITFDQIANFQNRLIQTANGGEVVPPLPIPRIEAENGDHDHLQQKFADAKSKGLASPNLVFDSESNWSKPANTAPTASSRTFASINGGSIITDRDAPMRRSMSSSVTQDPPVSPRAVMYDVTTSHRPTSPPLHSRNGSLSGLPSLLELNAAHRESFSLSQAVEQASRQPSHKTFESPSIAEEPSASHDSQYAVATSPVQQHPFNVGYTSPPLPLAELYRGNTFSPGGVGDSPRHQVQTTLPEDVWDRYGPQQGAMTPDLFDNSMSPDSSYLGAADPSRLLDDVAAQTSAATRALKGTDDGTTPTPPFRTKSISRKKSFKKVSKQISSPQLISTTQKLDHATQIPPVVDKTYPSTKSPGSVRSHVKASPSRTSQMGSFGKSFHRRRSSSFGHDAALPDESFGTPGSEGQSSTDRAPDVHPNHPYMNGGANSGSLSRLFSKINRRKNDQAYGGATIEPFPPELSAAVRASELSSQQAKQQQQQQQPVTPEMPSLPPIERSTPWTLPRMPSSASSTERTSSVRSPTSPIYTLPIDSTLMPRNKSKKRTPIVLKRESEVILPGDPGYMPTAIIGRSPEQRAKELAEDQQEGGRAVQHGNVQEQSTDTTLEKSSASERVDEGRNSGSLAAPAAAAVDAGTADKPALASPPSAAPVEEKLVQEEEPIKPAAADTVPLSAAQLVPPQPRSTDARKSLRDTIVRRTIIVPSGLDLSGDHRRSLNVSSSRKSRRFAAASTDEPVPLSGNTSKSFDVDSRAPATRLAPPPAADAEPREDEAGMSTSVSNATLHPRSNRASGVGSDYASSLYDMYISGEPDSPTSDHPAPPARHIEVTERADGSVVWQVIAGLADRGSVYSELDARQSRHWSDTISAPPVGGSFGREHDALLGGPVAELGFTGEEERSFFTRRRPGKEVFDLQNVAQEEPTRIVYHTDAQLASLLDVLAKGKDSAKFEFHLDPSQASNGEWQGSPIVDGNDVEAHRNRVEAEIFTLLNRRVVEGDA